MISHVEQVGGIGDIGSLIIIGNHPGWHQEAIGENRRTVSRAISIRIFQDQDPVIGHLPGLDVRIDS